ncbi:NADAR family protein [Micromonospora sp. NPDC005205]|uniref:NADAR family protein n=1 Tax=Micromonospora sp. NPDC005205 TaxID=3156714 RepID=UPI0033A65BE1
MTIYFYGADEVPYGCFSNFSGHGFDLDAHWWTTSEHYFQAQKFPGTRHAELIRRTATPLRAAELGRRPVPAAAPCSGPTRELLDAHLVAQQPDAAYTLTDLGRGAYQALRPLVRWSEAWASALSEDGEN